MKFIDVVNYVMRRDAKTPTLETIGTDISNLYRTKTKSNFSVLPNFKTIMANVSNNTAQISLTHVMDTDYYNMEIMRDSKGPFGPRPLHYRAKGDIARTAFDTLMSLSPEYQNIAWVQNYIIGAMLQLKHPVTRNVEMNRFSHITSYTICHSDIKITAVCDMNMQAEAWFKANISAADGYAPISRQYESYNPEFSKKIYLALQSLYQRNHA